ncbi:MAG: hypothetical protein U0790_20245 [Isosphaeraceae bacterium]
MDAQTATRTRSRPSIRLLLVAALAGLPAGCVLGPKQIDVGHLKYNRAIKESFDRELLLNLVRMKYRETPEFVDIGGVAAQYNFEATADASGKFFDFIDNFRGIGFGGSLGRAERPTITYAPLRGKDFETRLLAPVSTLTIGMMANKGWSVDRILRVAVRSINLLENATSAGGPTPAHKPEFEAYLHATALLRQLQATRGIEFVSADTEQRIEVPMSVGKLDGAFVLNAIEKGFRFDRNGDQLVLIRPKKDYVLAIHPDFLESQAVVELREMLNLEQGRGIYSFSSGERGRILASFDRKVLRASQEGGPLPPLPDPLPPGTPTPPVPAEIVHPDHSPRLRTDLGIQPRSLIEMMYYLSQNVEVPDAHVRQGLVTVTRDASGCPFDWNALLGGLFRVQVSRIRPLHAFVAVSYRGYWYSIADDDLESKATLGMLEELFNIEIRGGGVAGNLPVLTLGVGK